MKFANYSAIGLLGAASAFSAIVNVPGGIYTGSLNWTANNEYHIGGGTTGPVYIGDNGGAAGTLTIAPGTVIKGLPGDGANASALVITKNGTIIANGTVDAPIVFTTVYDNVNDPTDLGPYDRAMWGGVIILGEAPLSEPVPQLIEGISNVLQGEYGGSSPNDNSGSFSYVSIRHGGKLIGGANEINGLTMGGVGDGTSIHHVEVFANNDDGFEWFGGTVNAKYLISAYGNDDAFDFDFGYRGKLQYAYSVYHNGNTDANGNQGIEGDGYNFVSGGPGVGTDTTKASMPKWSNLTLAGSGPAVSNVWGTANDFAFRIREGAGGDFKNSIFQDWRGQIGRFDVGGPCWADCRILQDSLNFDGSLFWNIGTLTPANWTSAGFSGASVSSQGIIDATSDFANSGASNGVTFGSVDPRPTPAGPAYTIAKGVMGDPFFDVTSYSGAFGGENWAYKWSALWQSGIMKRWLRMQPGVANHRESFNTPARIIQSAAWDFVLFQGNHVAVNLPASTAFLDNNDVSATFRAAVWPAGVNNLTTGERTYKVTGQSGNTFGLGKHVLRLHMVLTNGMVLDEEFWFEVVTQ